MRLCGAVTAQGEAAVLDCLRAQRRNLSGPCKELVLQEQVEEAKDMRVDVRLVNACADDAARICANEGRSGVEGAVYDCLVSGRPAGRRALVPGRAASAAAVPAPPPCMLRQCCM